ncbi:hypothetical protein AGMMS49938_04730 [Fibrobacterales bacterium]|nr:hypothetical protein AGMMS49938_04730 [Fibrobacterales bacterium]
MNVELQTKDWRALMESKRKEFGLSQTTSSKSKSAENSAAKANSTAVSNAAKPARATAADFAGSIDEQVNSLRERSAEGLPVRELGNFIDVRA